MWITLVVSELSDITVTNGDKGQVGMVIQMKYSNMKKDGWLKQIIEIIDLSFNDLKKKE